MQVLWKIGLGCALTLGSFQEVVSAPLPSPIYVAQVAQPAPAAKIRKIKKRRLAKNPTPPPAAPLGQALPPLVFATLLLLMYRHRRKRIGNKDERSSGPSGFKHAHFAKPRQLKKEVAVDPATMTDDNLETGAIIPLNDPPSGGSQDRLPRSPYVQQGNDLSPEDLTAAGIKVDQDPHDQGNRRQQVPFSHDFPPEIARAFQGLPDERLILTTTFGAWGEEEGRMALTNRRGLVFYQALYTQWRPPFLRRESKRHTISYRQISQIDVATTKRVWTLWPGLVMCWFYPVGTFLSLLSFLTYGLLPRHVLRVRSKQSQRLYPLHKKQMERVAQTLAKLSTKPQRRPTQEAS